MKYNKEKAAEYYQRNKEKIKAKRKFARLNESPEKRKQRLAFHKKYNADSKNATRRKQLQQSDEYKYKYGYKYSAQKRGYSFELTFIQFENLFHDDCYLCGKTDAQGLDRVDNNLGYTITNTLPCCEMCNKIKWAHNLDDFITHITKIARHHGII